jgi:hypothetical protein
MVVPDELDIPLLPKLGMAWIPKGTQLAAMTSGTHAEAVSPGWPFVRRAWGRRIPATIQMYRQTPTALCHICLKISASLIRPLPQNAVE